LAARHEIRAEVLTAKVTCILKELEIGNLLPVSVYLSTVTCGKWYRRRKWMDHNEYEITQF
jgi:hypothetical protein